MFEVATARRSCAWTIKHDTRHVYSKTIMHCIWQTFFVLLPPTPRYSILHTHRTIRTSETTEARTSLVITWEISLKNCESQRELTAPGRAASVFTKHWDLPRTAYYPMGRPSTVRPRLSAFPTPIVKGALYQKVRRGRFHTTG